MTNRGHGTKYSYSQGGCRCDECRAANAAYQIESRKRRKKNGKPRVHNANTYGNYGCRCDVCVEAYRERYHRDQDARMGKQPPTHDASGYAAYGCRCEVCRKAKADYDRERRRRVAKTEAPR